MSYKGVGMFYRDRVCGRRWSLLGPSMVAELIAKERTNITIMRTMGRTSTIAMFVGTWDVTWGMGLWEATCGSGGGGGVGVVTFTRSARLGGGGAPPHT
jgi:hypothetical protein